MTDVEYEDLVLLICGECDEEYQVREETQHCPVCGKRVFDVNGGD